MPNTIIRIVGLKRYKTNSFIKLNDRSRFRLNEIQTKIQENYNVDDIITYSDVTEILNVEPKTGNTRKKHMTDVQQFMKLEQVGRGKFKIVEIYDSIQERDDNRGKSENSQQAIKKHNEENAVFTGEDLEKLNDSVSCVAIKHHLEEFDVTLEDYLGVSEMYRQREQGRQQIQNNKLSQRMSLLNGERTLSERLDSFNKQHNSLVRQEIQIENEFNVSDDEERLCTTNEMILPMKKSLVEVGLCNQYREQLDSHKNHYSTNNPNGYHDWAWCL